jgi:hypothetical protein
MIKTDKCSRESLLTGLWGIVGFPSFSEYLVCARGI